MQVLNREYPLERFDRYFTIFYLVVNPKTGHFKYSSAGHPPAIILKKNGEIELLDKRGMLIGLQHLTHSEDLSYEEGEGFLKDGDKVFLYTDGIIESKNPQGEQFGADRFYDLLKSLQKEPINTIIQKVYQTLSSFSNHFEDDVSLIGFEKGAGPF